MRRPGRARTRWSSRSAGTSSRPPLRSSRYLPHCHRGARARPSRADGARRPRVGRTRGRRQRKRRAHTDTKPSQALARPPVRSMRRVRTAGTVATRPSAVGMRFGFRRIGSTNVPVREPHRQPVVDQRLTLGPPAAAREPPTVTATGFWWFMSVAGSAPSALLRRRVGPGKRAAVRPGRSSRCPAGGP